MAAKLKIEKMPDTILEEDHPRVISAKCGSVVSEEKIFFLISSPLLVRNH
jgi:hypothetical protein